MIAPAKPFSESCQRNREPILTVLQQHFAGRRRVLEIGSGTGQHAVHFAAHLPTLQWQPTDRPVQLDGINCWRDEARLPNLQQPHALWADAATAGLTGDIAALRAPDDAVMPGFDAVFSANTLHIMGWPEVQALFAGLPALFGSDEVVLAIYGPFNDAGRYTSDSNRMFDAWLKARDARSGLRDVQAVDALAAGIGMHLLDDVAMPANNRMLIWRHRAA
ncbi:MAG: DUF938 domain-containing protein [Pseudoxanthomonas suwonensis]|nr:DUF938 domain-containing protein [Pseudoxanthomonas suwonensis]